MGTYVGITALNKSSEVRVPALVETPVNLAGTVNADAGSTFTAGTNTFYWVVTGVTASGDTLVSNEISKSVNGPRSEVETITVDATSGTFTITFSGQTTTGIPFNETTVNVQAALVALSNVDPGDIVVSGSASNYTLTFGGQYANTNVTQVTCNSGSLAGNTHTATPGTTTQGRPGDTVALTWDADPGAASYHVWRGTSAAAENHYQVASSNSLTDTGATGTAGTLPAADTAGVQVKLVPGTVTVVDIDDKVTRKVLNSHSTIGQYIVVAVNSTSATAGALPSNS